ncbi:hypothetical protein GCM10009119_11290 [Algoriphagus jejuensis]|uniref:HEAT repeat protein n=1 Tax=Algoriphagus jejuensis TaxID=419934 RepID=A0ABN1MXH8_9BACT
MHRVLALASLIFILLVTTSGVGSNSVSQFRNIKYQTQQTLDFPVAQINDRVIYDGVEQKDVTLYQYVSEEGFPVFYSRNVHTGVCYDNQCKLLNITLYWNPTGRYLGFELVDNEFLSKEDHVPFTDAEYVRLNKLLSDPDLPLGAFTFNQIAAKSKASLYKVDGVSGATAKDVLEYVVQGSAYTTFTLYELVYGDTKTEVESWTNEVMNDAYLENVLTKSPYQDQLWAIDLIHGRILDYPRSKEIVLDLMGAPDYSLAEKCLNSVVPEDLTEIEFQNKLIDKFQFFDFGMKSRTVELLKETTQISLDVVYKLNAFLPDLEVPIVSGVLDVFLEKGIDDPTTLQTIKEIANSENRYLAKKAGDYMDRLGN